MKLSRIYNQLIKEDKITIDLKKPAISEKDVDPEELKMGIKVEMEHTNDPAVAKIIALHHLAEDPKYYTKLKTIHVD